VKSLVTIGVPVYRGDEFLDEAVQSIRSQTHDHWQVVLSVDGPDPVCEELCRGYLDDPRFRLIVQPERLGWVRNIAWLQEQAVGEFWYYHQQDDLVDPTYLEVLVDEARRRPDAAVVFCDMATFGERTSSFTSPSVVGNPLARQLSMLIDHFAGVPFRGLTRVEALRQTGGGLSRNDVEDFAAETVWCSVMASWGDLIRVPSTLYRKRYHPGNVHASWREWDHTRRVRAWVAHCHDMLEVAMRISATRPERWLLWSATLTRLTSSRATGYLDWAALDDTARIDLIDMLITRARELDRVPLERCLGGTWEEIHRRSIEFASTGD
jgi:glycosyltransferase involved in cell wall biosynthesis